MTENVNDPRIVRTMHMLREALLELMEEQGFERITVKDITSKAGLNRGTFYLHYADKFDLLERITEEMMQGLRQIAQTFDPLDLVMHESRDTPFPFTVRLFEYFGEHARFFSVMLGPNGDPAFSAKFKEFMRVHLMDKFNEFHHSEDRVPVPWDYLMAYLISAHLGIVQYWLERGRDHTPWDMALMFTRMTQLSPIQSAGLKK